MTTCHCGATFTPARSATIHCSPACAYDAKKRRARERTAQAARPIECGVCQAMFTPARRDARYCSRSCTSKARVERSRALRSGQVELAPIDVEMDVLIQDVEFLIESGEYPDRIAKRVGMTPVNLIAAMRRANRVELARPFYRSADHRRAS